MTGLTFIIPNQGLFLVKFFDTIREAQNSVTDYDTPTQTDALVGY